tara:strand:- start:292 stop:486 length:195 start_codon:yes stop_codon:yes gene_type:complete
METYGCFALGIEKWTELFLDMSHNCDMSTEQIKGYCRRIHLLTNDEFNTLSQKVKTYLESKEGE